MLSTYRLFAMLLSEVCAKPLTATKAAPDPRDQCVDTSKIQVDEKQKRSNKRKLSRSYFNLEADRSD